MLSGAISEAISLSACKHHHETSYSKVDISRKNIFPEHTREKRMSTLSPINKTASLGKSAYLGMFFFFLLVSIVREVVAFNSYPYYAFVGVDDANIFFRYVENLFQFGGVFWNSSEGPVEGYSSPLWLLILYVCRFFTSNLASAAFATQLACSAATAVELVRVAEISVAETAAPQLHRFILIAVCCLLFIPCGYASWALLSLMDFSLWNFLCILSLRLLISRKDMRAALLLLFACRPEGMALALLFAGYKTVRDREFRTVGTLLLGGVILILSRYFYFGDILPNTFYAKVPESDSSVGFKYVLGFFLASYARIISVLLLCWYIFRHCRHFKAISDLYKSTFLITIFFAAFAWGVGGEHFPYYRLLLPLWPFLLITSISFMLQLPVWPRSVCFLVFAALTFDTTVDRFRSELRIASHGQETGEVLNIYFPKNPPRIAAIPVGGIAYRYHGEIQDLVGLNDRALAHKSKDRKGVQGHAIFDRGFFFRKPPELLVHFDIDCASRDIEKNGFVGRVLKGLFADPEFKARYMKFWLPHLRKEDGRPDPEKIGICGFVRRDFYEVSKLRVPYEIFQE